MNALAAAEVIRTNGGSDRNGACNKTASMMEDPQTPGSDCNSNPANDPQDLVGSDFIQDNMDYQWFIDYRDGGLHVHPSVLSSLSASYTKDDLGYYDDLARNLDANLAEVDMESFRTADIHTLLTALPVMCTDPVQHSEFNYQREKLASMSGSVLDKLDITSSISPRASSQGEDSACSTTNSISICKSSLLFSPVKEMPVLPPGGSYSVDSLDCEDMLITCQTNNKNNYTIAFEGSMAMYSDGSRSQDFENQEKQKVYEVPEAYTYKTLNLKNMLDLSMACSDSKIYTTWSNLKHSSISGTKAMMTRHPSGNNNTTPNFLQSGGGSTSSSGRAATSKKSRSQSLPDLRRARDVQPVEIPLNFSVDSGENSSRSGRINSSGSLLSRSMNDESSDSVGNTLSSNRKLQNMSLVRLFMKQKSMSTEGMSLTLDQTDSSSETGWPTSNSDSGTNNTAIQKQLILQQQYQNLDNDLAIKWVKTDNYHPDVSKRTSNCSTSMEELLNTSRSVSSLGKDGSSSRSRRSAKTTGVQARTEVEDNGVQTSLIYPELISPKDSSGSNVPLRETLVNEKPVYVVYPNYTLPDLSFLNSAEAARFDHVALKPQMFGRRSASAGAKRPFSCNDLDALKQRGFSHVKDWESLTFLLPSQYRKILHDVPEVPKHVKLLGEEKKPLFCLSPPMRHRKRTTLSDMIPNTIINSSSSSTATQPSSGYRGSSTILTDSSSNQQNSGNSALGNNPLYLYRYDSVSSEASLHAQEKLYTSRQTTPSHQRYTGGVPTLPKRSISLQSNDPVSAPPRPPLPRSILRKNRAAAAAKRCSMFEMGQVNEVDANGRRITQENKRMSLQEPYYMNNDLQLLRQAGILDSEKDIDEIEEKQQFERLRGLDNDDLESSSEDVKQLEEFLKRSGFSSHSSDGDTGNESDADLKLRSCVRRFLALKVNQDMAKLIDMADSQKKTVSFAVNRRPRYADEKANILEEQEYNMNMSEANESTTEMRPVDLLEKNKMVYSVSKSVDSLLKFWHSEPVRSRHGYNDKNECSQLCLSQLCPALYAIMSDGLKPQLHSTFGPIANSVWQVVEASSQQGPLTKTLNDLVQKINAEDFITEGMLKFHAFVFGLLNLRALDAWFAYLCTRESILRKHYSSNSLFVSALSCANSREIVDAFLNTLQPLAFCPFQLDLLYQYRQLHSSFGQGTGNINLETSSSRKQSVPMRPRSCVIYDRDYGDNDKRHEEQIKKRWSCTPLSTKFHVYDRLDDSEDYTDSLEHSPLNRASPRRAITNKSRLADSKADEPTTGKFRRLQEKWEHLGRDTSPKEPHPSPAMANSPSPSSPTRTTPTSQVKSKIPRLLTSPVKCMPPSNLPVPVKSKSSSAIPSSTFKKPGATSVKAAGQQGKKVEMRNNMESPRRTSRLDQDGAPRPHLTRPSSLPYKAFGYGSKDKNAVSPHRRAASTSLPRPHSIAAPPRVSNKPAPKSVRTLTSKPKSEDGHLSFHEGEKLKVIFEVDSKWLLCSRGESKGLVPRNCVRPIQT